MKRLYLCATWWLLAGAAVCAQQTGPITPPPGREVKRIPVGQPTEAPPLPPEEIIRRFAEKEDQYARAYASYTWRLSVRVVEYNAEGAAAGEARLLMETYTKPDGQRWGRYLEEPPPTLQKAHFTVADLAEFSALRQYPLTTDQLEKYEINYVGKQTIDELEAFAFNVRPKSVDRREPRFEGVVYVDDRDFEIVKTYGRFATEVLRDDPFLLFETYREVVHGMRLPTYVRADGEMKVGDETVPLRLTLRYSDYEPPK